MREDVAFVRHRQASPGTKLIRVTKPYYVGYGGEATVHDSLHYLEAGEEEDDYAQRGTRVIAGLVRLVQYNAVRPVERGGVEPVGNMGE